MLSFGNNFQIEILIPLHFLNDLSSNILCYRSVRFYETIKMSDSTRKAPREKRLKRGVHHGIFSKPINRKFIMSFEWNITLRGIKYIFHSLFIESILPYFLF
jgi:hypothetical protein